MFTVRNSKGEILEAFNKYADASNFAWKKAKQCEVIIYDKKEKFMMKIPKLKS